MPSDADLTRIYNACDPLRAAEEDQYVDSNKVRGEQALRKKFCRALQRSQGSPLRFLFTGHNGSGKSTELKHLLRELSNPSERSAKRHFPIYIDAQPFFDEFDADATEIFLAIVSEVAARLRGVGIELQQGCFPRKLEEIRTFFAREVDVDKITLPVGGAEADLKLLGSSRELRQQVRKSLAPDLPRLPEEIALVLEEARVEVRKQGFEDIVLVIDNLEKIRRFGSYAEGELSHRELFTERAPIFTRMNVHLALTVPLTLARTAPADLQNRYDSLLVLPMIKIVERDRKTAYPEGRRILKEILHHRCFPTPLEEVITNDALESLITYSGGYVRGLINFMREAIGQIDAMPVDQEAARAGLAPTITTYAPTITPTQWRKLAQLEVEPNQQIDPDDPDYRKMLEQTFVMEYINGGADVGLLDESAPWYGVHPILRELRQFKSAKAALDAEAAKAATTP